MSRLTKKKYNEVREEIMSTADPYSVESFNSGYDHGFIDALKMFSIWRDGEQRIGCLDTPIKEIFVELGFIDADT